jgi:TolB-like protein
MSPARDHDWFCEGIAEEILNALTKLPGLRVATRTSAFRFKDPARNVRTIGGMLGVTTLLEGSVRTAGSRLRVTAQLVNASDGYQLWSERFDRQIKDVFEIQDEIAKRVVEALELRLVAPSGAPGEVRHSNDIEAYQLFLKGRHFRYTKLDLKSALRCFEQGVERDPTYALARIALAETLVVLFTYGMIRPSVGAKSGRGRSCEGRTSSPGSPPSSGASRPCWRSSTTGTRAPLSGRSSGRSSSTRPPSRCGPGTRWPSSAAAVSRTRSSKRAGSCSWTRSLRTPTRWRG